jgi:NADPH:quinone reductase-like Zn-dependent oxidoreductase
MGIDEMKSQSQGGRLASANGSVGKFVLQLARHYQFKTINVIRGREQESIIRNLGGDEVICKADEDLRARLQELTAGRGIERAIDCVAGEVGAEIFYHLLTTGQPYQESIFAERETQHRQRNLFNLHARARAFGYQLIPLAAPAGSVP